MTSALRLLGRLSGPTLALAAFLVVLPAEARAGDGNPCAARSLNPCAAKALNPCGAKGNPCNPCGAKNPCNPCGSGGVDPARFKQPQGVELAGGPQSALVVEGERLWNDRTLGNSGLACATCHIDNYGQMKPGFAKPYPHYVAMPSQQAGVAEVNAAEMVNFCMIVPMAADPLTWDSQKLAALAAYVEHIQPGYRRVDAAAPNPCNPCAAKGNPCNPRISR
jgi:hypothetical protein